jgi:hypothetical protein
VGAQVPPGTTAHDLQLPHGPLEQQTPSVQWPLEQSVPAAQCVPSGRGLVHEPVLQMSPGMQSLLPLHIVRQAPPPQT